MQEVRHFDVLGGIEEGKAVVRLSMHGSYFSMSPDMARHLAWWLSDQAEKAEIPTPQCIECHDQVVSGPGIVCSVCEARRPEVCVRCGVELATWPSNVCAACLAREPVAL